jgi:hypothetical protein
MSPADDEGAVAMSGGSAMSSAARERLRAPLSRRAAPALGVALGLLVAVLALFALEGARRTTEAARPRSLTASGVIVSDDSGPLGEILMHYVPELEPTFAATYHDFLGTLPPATRVVFVVRRGARPRLDAFLASVDPGHALAERTRVLEIDTPLGIWSKDRALVLAPRDASGGARTELVIPPRPRPGEGSRPADWDIIPAVAAAMPEAFEMRQLPLAFDAGDFAIAGARIVFDVNLFARNRGRGYRSPQELRERMKSLLGRDIVMLGSEPGDVPRHHMSMYMAALDGATALVGDPEAGAAYVGRDYAPGESSPESRQPLRADFSRETVARFDRAAADLTAAGFTVVRIPTVPFDDKTYFAYTNGVYETRAGRRTAWVPSFGVPALDRAAREVYERLGWTVIPVSVRDVYTQHGTIGCLVNVLSRAE